MVNYPLWTMNIYTQLHSCGEHHKLDPSKGKASSLSNSFLIKINMLFHYHSSPQKYLGLISKFNSSTRSLRLFVQTYSKYKHEYKTNSGMSQKEPRLFVQLFGNILIKSHSLWVGINSAPDPLSFMFPPASTCHSADLPNMAANGGRHAVFTLELTAVLSNHPVWTGSSSADGGRLWHLFTPRSLIMKNHTQDSKTDG